MAALNRPVTATYTVNETVRVDTQDNEDHTFCGIMFPIRAKAILPVDRIIIESVAVRGQLGDLSVWISNASCGGNASASMDPTPARTGVSASFRLTSKYWTKVYQRKHKASPRTYTTLDLSAAAEHLVLFPGQVRMIYVHSTLPNDTAIVYDNASTNMFGGPMNNNVSSIRYQDDKIAIHTGKAHLSFEPFGQEPIWGWGNAWRDRREFVGQIKYGTVYKLWNPERCGNFGNSFQAATMALLMLQRRNTVFARLPDECLFYILNMCRWDWFDDTGRDLKQKYKARKRLQRDRDIQQRHEMSLSEVAVNAAVDTYGNSRVVSEPFSDIHHDDAMESHAGLEDSDDDMNQDEEESNVDDDDDGEEDDDSNASAWERAHGYRADSSRFIFHVVSSDDESDDSDDGDDTGADRDGQVVNHHHHPWFGHRVARQLVVRALGRGDRSTTGR